MYGTGDIDAETGNDLIALQGGNSTIDGGNLTQATFADGVTTSFQNLLSTQFAIGNTQYAQVNTGLPDSGGSDASSTVIASGAAVKTQSGTPATQNLTLFGSADLVGSGNNVDDVISANSGDDTLIAGSANDTLVGGGGANVYVVSGAAGTLTTINASTEADVLALGAGITQAGLDVSTALASDGSLLVTMQDNLGGQIVINGAANGDGSSTLLDQLSFADGSTASLGELIAQLTSGPTAATSAVNVTLAGGMQNMTLSGSSAVSATANDLHDLITAGAANDNNCLRTA